MTRVHSLRKLAAAGAGVGAIAAVCALFAPAVFAGGAQWTTLHFREPSTNSTFVDAGRKGTSQGDYLAWLDPLRNVASGKLVGKVGGVCTLVDLKSQLYDCAPVTYLFNDGSTIFVDGFFSGKGKPETDPIVGGTGRYYGVHGLDTVTLFSATVTDHVLKFQH